MTGQIAPGRRSRLHGRATISAAFKTFKHKSKTATDHTDVTDKTDTTAIAGQIITKLPKYPCNPCPKGPCDPRRVLLLRFVGDGMRSKSTADRHARTFPPSTPLGVPRCCRQALRIVR